MQTSGGGEGEDRDCLQSRIVDARSKSSSGTSSALGHRSVMGIQRLAAAGTPATTGASGPFLHGQEMA